MAEISAPASLGEAPQAAALGVMTPPRSEPFVTAVIPNPATPLIGPAPAPDQMPRPRQAAFVVEGEHRPEIIEFGNEGQFPCDEDDEAGDSCEKGKGHIGGFKTGMKMVEETGKLKVFAHRKEKKERGC